MNTYDNENNPNTSESENTAQQKPAAPGYGSSSGAGSANTGAFPYTTQTAAPGYAGNQYPQYQAPQAYQTPIQPRPQQNSYSWGPAAPTPQSYYQQQKPAPKKKGHAGKFLIKTLAAVLACAVVSLGSVGVFAGMIQNGVVNIESPEDAQETAAFTLYKRVDTGADATPTGTKAKLSTQGVAQKVIPSVVCVQNYQIVQQQSDLFRYFYGMGGAEEGSGELSPAGEGSGIIISEDGYIVTNHHVISGADRLSVVTSDGTSYEAELIGEDSQTDLAVIKVNTDDKLTPAEFGSSDDLQVTDQVLAIGNPGGLQFNSSVTIGYVSALNRPVTNSDTGFVVNCIQTDAAINPGNSGGALVNLDGLVVGINSSKIAATEYEGMGFAIPSTVVQPIVSDLIDYGYVRDRAMLGVTAGEYVNRARASFYGLPQGYCVGEPITDSAKASGIRAYDIITAIDDTQVVAESTISSYLATKKPGDKVTLTVERPLTGESGLKIELTLSANTGSNS